MNRRPTIRCEQCSRRRVPAEGSYGPAHVCRECYGRDESRAYVDLDGGLGRYPHDAASVVVWKTPRSKGYATEWSISVCDGSGAELECPGGSNSRREAERTARAITRRLRLGAAQ